MADLSSSSSSNLDFLDLTMAIPGSSSSPPSSDGMRNFDINEIPCGTEELAIWMEEEEEIGPARKKLRLTKEQSRVLEESFRKNYILSPKQKEALAAELRLKPRQVEVWFQNRRARTKLKQTERDCEHLKRCFGSLTEENQRLQREVEKLRAMRVAPPTVFSPLTCEPLPASALTMCPRCERITTTTPTTTNTYDKNRTTTTTSPHIVHMRQSSAAC